MKYVKIGLKITLALAVMIFLIIAILYGRRNIPLNNLKSKYADATSTFVIVQGMNVHYRDEGDRSDSIPIILIHGTGSSLHTYDEWAQGLKESNRIVRLDLPAYGLTGPFPNRNYTMSHYTIFLRDFLTALDVKECVLVGNSLGGQIAWNFALEEERMVSKLILIDAAGYPKKSKSVPIAFKLAQIPVLSKLLTFITPRFLVRSSVENVYFDKSKVSDLLVDRYYDLTLRKGNRQAFVDRLSMSKDVNKYEKIKNIQQPTLILWGEEDLLIPVENAYRFHKDLPNDTLVIIKDTGHTPMEESPTESLRIVFEFLK